MSEVTDLVSRLESCPPGMPGWKCFEDLCVEILTYLFVGPLTKPTIQPRTFSGVERRDAIFPNRNIGANNNWGLLLQELAARMILFEFKNYDASSVGSGEVVQTESYMREPMGRLAIMVCSKLPDESAHRRRNTVFSDRKKVILFLTKDHLIEMLYAKERGEDPSDLIVDLVEAFYVQHE